MTTPFIPGTHEAYDHATPMRTPKLAMGDGLVTYSGWDDRFPVGSTNGRGQYVDVDHGIIGGAWWMSRQMHFSECLVSVGAVVHQGQWIGLSGSTGLSTGPHSHDELWRDGVKVDWLPLVT